PVASYIRSHPAAGSTPSNPLSAPRPTPAPPSPRRSSAAPVAGDRPATPATPALPPKPPSSTPPAASVVLPPPTAAATSHSPHTGSPTPATDPLSPPDTPRTKRSTPLPIPPSTIRPKRCGASSTTARSVLRLLHPPAGSDVPGSAALSPDRTPHRLPASRFAPVPALPPHAPAGPARSAQTCSLQFPRSAAPALHPPTGTSCAKPHAALQSGSAHAAASLDPADPPDAIPRKCDRSDSTLPAAQETTTVAAQTITATL